MKKYLVTFKKELFSTIEIVASSVTIAEEMCLDLIDQNNLPETSITEWEVYDVEEIDS